MQGRERETKCEPWVLSENVRGQEPKKFLICYISFQFLFHSEVVLSRECKPHEPRTLRCVLVTVLTFLL